MEKLSTQENIKEHSGAFSKKAREILQTIDGFKELQDFEQQELAKHLAREIYGYHLRLGADIEELLQEHIPIDTFFNSQNENIAAIISFHTSKIAAKLAE
ncbi:MAG: hypothetical protein CMI56_02005 [Parcubacteria group bacterium]|nr:hypothetical protein [Parcubacteria group bacterium]|tara:strand:- start:3871 stop:4170 length:300 start_codon:yes stop_codon:yes gene_type:complete